MNDSTYMQYYVGQKVFVIPEINVTRPLSLDSSCGINVPLNYIEATIEKITVKKYSRLPYLDVYIYYNMTNCPYHKELKNKSTNLTISQVENSPILQESGVEVSKDKNTIEGIFNLKRCVVTMKLEEEIKNTGALIKRTEDSITRLKQAQFKMLKFKEIINESN